MFHVTHAWEWNRVLLVFLFRFGFFCSELSWMFWFFFFFFVKAQRVCRNIKWLWKTKALNSCVVLVVGVTPSPFLFFHLLYLLQCRKGEQSYSAPQSYVGCSLKDSLPTCSFCWEVLWNVEVRGVTSTERTYGWCHRERGKPWAELGSEYRSADFQLWRSKAYSLGIQVQYHWLVLISQCWEPLTETKQGHREMTNQRCLNLSPIHVT